MLKSVYEIYSLNSLAVLRSYWGILNPVDLRDGSVGDLMGPFRFILIIGITVVMAMGVILALKPSPKETTHSTSEERQPPTSEVRQAPTPINKKTNTPSDSKPVYGVIPGKFVYDYDQIHGCLDIRSTGKFEGKDLPELVIVCQELLKAWKAQIDLDDNKYRKNKIEEFLSTFTKK